jgi:pyruvate carboxylase
MAIEARVGSAVRIGQPLVTLEAMKMNTAVTAQAAGVVAVVHVAPGDTVEEGQPLMTLR